MTYKIHLNFPLVVDKFEVGIGEINYDTAETSSKNLKVSGESSTRLTSDLFIKIMSFYVFADSVVRHHVKCCHLNLFHTMTTRTQLK